MFCFLLTLFVPSSGITRISRNEAQSDCPIHFFSSHFFTKLIEDGAEAVTNWNGQKKIDILSKKFICIPINSGLHWSLCVVVNPGDILNRVFKVADENSNFPCILLMDSLEKHCKEHVAENVRVWLNSVWRRQGKVSTEEEQNPFTSETMKVYAPKSRCPVSLIWFLGWHEVISSLWLSVPLQKNGCDCGAFVCRYAFGLYSLRHHVITYGDVKSKRIPFEDFIEKGSAFNFDSNDIAQWRSEMVTLLGMLSTMYLKQKYPFLCAATPVDNTFLGPVSATSSVDDDCYNFVGQDSTPENKEGDGPATSAGRESAKKKSGRGTKTSKRMDDAVINAEAMKRRKLDPDDTKTFEKSLTLGLCARRGRRSLETTPVAAQAKEGATAVPVIGSANDIGRTNVEETVGLLDNLEKVGTAPTAPGTDGCTIGDEAAPTVPAGQVHEADMVMDQSVMSRKFATPEHAVPARPMLREDIPDAAHVDEVEMGAISPDDTLRAQFGLRGLLAVNKIVEECEAVKEKVSPKRVSARIIESAYLKGVFSEVRYNVRMSKDGRVRGASHDFKFKPDNNHPEIHKRKRDRDGGLLGVAMTVLNHDFLLQEHADKLEKLFEFRRRSESRVSKGFKDLCQAYDGWKARLQSKPK